MLASEALGNDKRIKKAKALIRAALKDHQKKITGIAPAQKSLSKQYRDKVSKYEKLRGGALWYPYLSSGLGNGALIQLADGSIKYDFISGIGVHFGHSLDELMEASIDAALQSTIMQGNLQQSVHSISLLEELVRLSKLDHGILTTSGAMAGENALKLAFQKKFPARRMLGFERAFGGRTLALAFLTDKPAYREGLPTTLSVDQIPFFDPQNPKESTECAVNRLKMYLNRYPGDYAGMVFELIQGEGGFYPGSRDFFVALMEVLKTNKIPIIVDEIQTFSRTESPFAFQHFKLEKYVDIATVGKITQVCATLFKDEFKPKPGLISQTFTGASASIEAGKTILKALKTGNYFGPKGKNAKIRAQFDKHLKRLEAKYPNKITGPYGLGIMIAFTPFRGDKDKVSTFLNKLYDEGVVGFSTGANPMRVRFLIPAGGVTLSDIDIVMGLVEKVLKSIPE